MRQIRGGKEMLREGFGTEVTSALIPKLTVCLPTRANT
jgi:hypothetical protein